MAEHIENRKRTKRGMGESGNEDLVNVLLRVKESGDLTFPVTNNNIKAVLMVSECYCNELLLHALLFLVNF